MEGTIENSPQRYKLQVLIKYNGNGFCFEDNDPQTYEELKVRTLHRLNVDPRLFYIEFTQRVVNYLKAPENAHLVESYHAVLESLFDIIASRKIYIAFNWDGGIDSHVEFFRDMLKRHTRITGIIISDGSLDYLRAIDLIADLKQIDTIQFAKGVLDVDGIDYVLIYLSLKNKLEKCKHVKVLRLHTGSYNRFLNVNNQQRTVLLREMLDQIYFIDHVFVYNRSSEAQDRNPTEILYYTTERNRTAKRLIVNSTFTYLMIAKRRDNVTAIVGKDVNLLIAKLIYANLSENSGIKSFAVEKDFTVSTIAAELNVIRENLKNLHVTKKE